MDLRIETEQLIFLIPITILTCILILLKTRSSKHNTNPLPPGPWKLPIIGNLHHLAMGSSSSLPHRRLCELAGQYGPLMHLQLGEISTVVVSSPEFARQFMQTHDLNFATRPIFPSANIIFYGGRDIGFAPYGQYWKHMRKVCAVDLLSPKRVSSFVPFMEQEIVKLRSRILGFCHSSDQVNMSQMLKSLGSSITCGAAFGMSQEQADCFLPIIEQMVNELAGFGAVDLFPSSKLLRRVTGAEARLQKIHNDSDAILEALIADHLARRSGDHDDAGVVEDFVDVLLNLREKSAHDLGFAFSNVEIKGVLTDIFLAGSDTWTATSEWALSELMKNPKEMEKAQREVRQVFHATKQVEESKLHQLHYLNLIIKETLRLHPPGPLTVPRECRETVDIGGYQIPAKTKVIINAWAIGQDCSYWTEPNKFCPERFRNNSVDFKGQHFQFIPFGAGRRICPGLHYATTVVSLLLANLLYHFDWKLPEGMTPENVDLDERFGFEVRKKNDLFLVPNSYVQS
ncbi:Desmethyl-deoxy-podophyllotoxin synthase [Linum grandiflorum]